MKKRADQITSFEDANLPNDPYIISGDFGDVVIQPKNKGNHTGFIGQNDPHIFLNLGHVILHPDNTKVNPSSDPKAVKKQKNGNHVVYEKYDFYETIDSPKKYSNQNMTMHVVVFFGNNNKNHTETYYQTPNGEKR